MVIARLDEYRIPDEEQERYAKLKGFIRDVNSEGIMGLID